MSRSEPLDENFLSSRVVGLDAFRAILALLGIFFHSALSYTKTTSILQFPWYYHSASQHYAFTWFALWVHSFRMPGFFFLSGLISHIIYSRKKLSGLTYSRVTRILLPFIVLFFLPSVELLAYFLGYPISKYFSWHLFFTDTGGFWFLYFLIFMDFAVIVFLFCQRVADFQYRFFIKSHSCISCSVLLFIPFLVSLFSFHWYLPVDTSIFPNPLLLLIYFCFFLLGWLAKNHVSQLQQWLKPLYWIFIFLSILFISIDFYLYLFYLKTPFTALVGTTCYSLASIFMLFGLLGFCLVLMSAKNPVVQYFSDASYWLYICQFQLIVTVQPFLDLFNLSVLVKFFMVVFISLVLSLLSYQCFIRHRYYFRYIDCSPKN